jgi:hypothetical protein
LESDEMILRGSELLEVRVEAQRFRQRDQELARARERLMILGVERYGLKLKDLPRKHGESPDGMTKAVARAVRRRTDDDGFRRNPDELDRALAEVER